MIFNSPKEIDAIVKYDERQREDWANNQNTWRDIRFNGMNREKQYDWQSDLPSMLADEIIERLKPQDIAHIFNGELLMEFTSREPIANETAATVMAQSYDGELRNNSNYPKEIKTMVDLRLMYGGCFVGFDWDYVNSQMDFRSLKMLDVVVPWGVKHIDKSPHFCLKEVISPVDYALDSNFTDQTEATIKKLMGSVETEKLDEEQRKAATTGFLQSVASIEIRRFYQRSKDGWTVYTYCPSYFDKFLREPYQVPYEINGKPFAPIVFFPLETVEDGDIYSSRGIPQKVAHEEAELTRLKNQRLDATYLASIPYLTSTIETAVAANIKLGTLKAMPQGMDVKHFPFPNVNFDAAMADVRSGTEKRASAFDSTISDMASTSSRRSAAESELIGGVASQGTNMRYRILRDSLCELYKKSYAVWKYHNPGSAKIYVNGQEVEVTAEAKGAKYEIQPAGSEVTWSKERRTQQYLQIYQTLGNSPTFQPYKGWFEKQILTSIEPRLGARYNPDGGAMMANERERQLVENLVLDKGIMLGIEAQDDDAVHAVTLYEDIAKAMMEMKQMLPQESRAKTQHLQEHLQALKGKNKAAYGQVMDRIAQIKATVEQMVQKRQAEMGQQQAPMMAA